MEALVKVRSCDFPRQLRVPAPKNNTPAAPERRTPVISQQCSCLCVFLFLILFPAGQANSDHHPYQPDTWMLRNPTDGRVIAQTVSNNPSFVVNLNDIFYPQGVGQHVYWGTYWCPSSNPGKSYCTYPGYWFCGYWGCETIVTSDRWAPIKGDEFLEVNYWPQNCEAPTFDTDGMVKKRGSCTHLKVTVLQPQDKNWSLGKMWSVFLHKWGTDWSTVVQIIRVLPQSYAAIGPNKALIQVQNKHKGVVNPQVTSIANATLKPGSLSSLSINSTYPHSALEATSYDLFHRMLDAVFLSLNASEPNLTNSCWLCYNASPPFYEGVALNAPFNYSKDSSPKQCLWDTPRKGITLEQISGQGVCVGNQQLMQQNKHVCKTIVAINNTYSWAVPSAPGVWACNTTGITPCISIKDFTEANDFCVQVVIIPRVLYHTDDEVIRYLGGSLQHQKQELVTSISLAVILSLGAAGTATGVSDLVSQKQGLTQLHTTIDKDLHRIESSISFLEKSLSSLSEMVLQNRPGLDLLFMHQGGLCAALNEELCCFYANHSGVIRNSMAELRERLAQRKTEQLQQSWFESLFNHSP
ncbi:MLV-related proviral Env polyprotein-like [Oenanthe melanoleuca]|uniref:MLV-related proviral Env polyprotein-like n=1 Tax=Oenanthe melanoleuca TaxID=2939378 RepID=UPI0024C124FB|nr:MLV-related proviral Env polyprotein-like [Oenanthe melanoleuca]